MLLAKFPISHLAQTLTKRLEKQLEDVVLENTRLRAALKSGNSDSSQLSPKSGLSSAPPSMGPALPLGGGALQPKSIVAREPSGSSNMNGSEAEPDSNCKITKDRLEVLLKRLNPDFSDKEFQSAFSEVEVDQQGEVLLMDFLDVFAPVRKPSYSCKLGLAKTPSPEELETIQSAFKKFDKDASNKIDLKELAILCQELGKNLTAPQLEEGMKQMDQNGDMTVDFDEFLYWWMSKPNLGGFLTPKDVRNAVADAASLMDAPAGKPTIGHQMHHSHQIFADQAKLLENVRKSVLNPYEESQHYHQDGILQRIAGSPKFELATSGVIAFNAIWMSIDLDVGGSKGFLDKHPVFQIAEMGFFSWFLFEWIVRFGAFRNKVACLSDRWFLFDTALVVMMLVDTFLPIILGSGGSGKTSMLRLVRLVKLTRMARVAKVLRQWPELTILIKGLSIAARSVSSTLALMLVLVYVFSMAFRQLTNDTAVGEEYFRSVLFGMKELIFQSAIPDNAEMVNALGDENILLAVLAMVFLILAAMTLMNMLIGVLCEVIGVVSSVEKESMKVTFVKQEIMGALKESNMPVHENLIITKDEFQKMLMNPVAAKAIRTVGVDPVGLVDFADFIFSGHCNAVSKTQLKQGLTCPQFIELLLELGGTNAARVKDMIDLRKVLLHRFDSIDDGIRKQHSYVQQLILSLSRDRQYENRMLRQVEI
jgi:calmodulin